MRGRKERRYLTEKYQRKQIRLAYALSYAKPYDKDRYIRTEFARKRRFVDMLYGNFVEWKRPSSMDLAIGGYRYSHTLTPEELGRYRNHSWKDCGSSRCRYCSNPRRGHNWDGKQVTRQEEIVNMKLKEELYFYKKGE